VKNSVPASSRVPSASCPNPQCSLHRQARTHHTRNTLPQAPPQPPAHPAARTHTHTHLVHVACLHQPAVHVTPEWLQHIYAGVAQHLHHNMLQLAAQQVPRPEQGLVLPAKGEQRHTQQQACDSTGETDLVLSKVALTPCTSWFVLAGAANPGQRAGAHTTVLPLLDLHRLHRHTLQHTHAPPTAALALTP
jgi:hypothetical protein